MQHLHCRSIKQFCKCVPVCYKSSSTHGPALFPYLWLRSPLRPHYTHAGRDDVMPRRGRVVSIRMAASNRLGVMQVATRCNLNSNWIDTYQFKFNWHAAYYVLWLHINNYHALRNNTICYGVRVAVKFVFVIWVAHVFDW